jgi:ribonuclease HI
MERDAAAPTDFVRLFTDGACSGNPGPGGWAFILLHPASGKIVESSGAEPETTNNRMELMGAIEGLSTLKKPCRVELVTDSQYVAKGISQWMPNWKRQGWMRKEGGRLKPVVNLDLWQRIDALLATHRVEVTHVLGHNGHPENEACDRMAVAAYKALVKFGV